MTDLCPLVNEPHGLVEGELDEAAKADVDEDLSVVLDHCLTIKVAPEVDPSLKGLFRLQLGSLYNQSILCFWTISLVGISPQGIPRGQKSCTSNPKSSNSPSFHGEVFIRPRNNNFKNDLEVSVF